MVKNASKTNVIRSRRWFVFQAVWMSVISMSRIVTGTTTHDIFGVSAPPEVNYQNPVTFAFLTDFTRESHIVCFWDFDDGNHLFTTGEDLKQGVSHLFDHPGHYSVLTTCQTSRGFIHKRTQVDVIRIIDSLQCVITDTNATEREFFRQGTDIVMHYQHEYTTDLQYTLLIDNVIVYKARAAIPSPPTILVEDSLIIPDQSDEIQAGHHNVTLHVTNDRVDVHCDKLVTLMTVVSGVTLSASQTAVLPASEVVLQVTAESGYPAMIEWTMKKTNNESFAWNLVKERSGRTVLDVEQITVFMPDVGDYQVTARIYNNLSSDEDTIEIKTQYPVTSVILTSNSPINFEAENTIRFSVQILDSPLPQCLKYFLEFGDGNHENFSVPTIYPWYAGIWPRKHLNGTLISIYHTYTTPDVYNTKITIYNDLSSVTNETTVAVLEPISYLTIRLSHHSGIYFPSIDNDWFWQEPPFIYPVVVENEYTLELRGTGTPQYVIWTMANNGNRYQHNTTDGVLYYQFPTNGTFTISASASNAYSHYVTQEETVTAANAIVGQYLISNSPGVGGEVMTFVVLVQKLGLNSSFSIDYGDGLSEDVAEPQRDNNVMRFIPGNLALPSDPMKSYVTILNHTYDAEGVYAPRLTGSNTAMEWVSITYVHIESNIQPCKIPAIHIKDGGSNYYQAKKYSSSQALIFGASVNIDCWRAKRTNFKWSIYKIESLFTVPSSSNQVSLPPSISTDAADVYISQYTLGYGMYIVRLTVTVVMKDEGDASMESTAHSYIEVIPSDLVARIRGGSSLAIGWYSNITLDASDSYDPDVIPGQSHDDLIYTWYCRHDNASFPANMTDTPNLQTTGGCLGTGFLLSGDSVNNSITISAQTLAGNQSYVFLLKLSKSDRKNRYAEQTITILPGTPPTLALRCLMNCGSQLNPSARLILTGKCTDCTASTQPSFEWTLLPGNATNTRQTLDWSKDTTTGRYYSYLAIQAGVFAGSHDETYILRLQISSKSGSTNFAEYTFMTNSPPTLGRCSITPSEGLVLVTEFSIECSGFEDIHTPLTYTANAVTGAERSAGVSSLSDSSQQGSFLFYGVDPIIPATFLPLGLSSHDFRVEIKIHVTDSLGSSVETSLFAVVRESEQLVDVEGLALQLTSDKDSQLNQLLDEGNYQSATQVINTVSSMLNVEAEKDGDQVDEGALVEKKQQRAEARESLLNMLSHVEVNSLESIQLTSSAISQITSEIEEISPQAQVSTTKAIQSMSSVLKQQSDMGVGGEAVEGAAKFIVSGLSNIMSSTAVNQGQNTSENTQLLEQDLETKRQARNITLASLHALDDVQAAIFLNKVPGEQPTILQTDSLSIILQRQERQDLDGLMLQTEKSDVVFRLPAGLSTAIDQHGASSFDEVIDTQIHHFQHNPFSWSENSSRVTSHVTSLKLGHGIDQSDIAVQTLPQAVEMMVINGDDIKPMLLRPSFNQLTNQVLYSLNVTNEESSVIITVAFNQSSDSMEAPALNLSLYYDSPPNNTNRPSDASTTLPSNQMENQMKWNTTNVTFDPYIWVIPSEKISGTGAYFVTVDGGEGVDVRNLHLLVYAFGSQCLYWDEATEEWLGDGCKVGPLTSMAKTHCLCSHLTSFASSFLVMPNAVDLTDLTLFANVAENPVTVITVAVVFIIFGLGAVWARRKDRLEIEKAHLIVLEDNDPEATYRYHITVFTGMRRGAGTTATVTLTLQGIVNDSEPHVLATGDKKHPVLKNSGIDSFLLVTKEPLGILRSVRVWHDNAGSSPEWYLSRILVHDLETDRWWYFLCHTWIAVDLAEGEIDKTFPVATPEDLKGFHNLFFTKTARDMKDYHLWFSVLSRPPRSSFTRLQRLACCWSLLMSTMLVNIMFYKAGEGKVDETYNFGVMSISMNTLVIAVESSLLAYPLNLAIVQIFRESRSRNEELEIVAMHGKDEIHVSANVDETEKSSELKAAALNMPGTPSAASSMNSQNSNTGISLAPESPSELTTSLNPQCGHRSSALRQGTLPERELFSSDEAYEEYIDKHAEFVYLRSTCNSLNNFKNTSRESSPTSSCNIQQPESKQSTRTIKVPAEGDVSKQEHQRHFRLELLPECDQGILSHYIREPTPELSRNQNTNRNSGASSSASSTGQQSSLSNPSGHNTSSISISISSPSSNESATYTHYQEYLSTRLSVLYEQLHNPPPNQFKSEEDRMRALRKFKLVLAIHGWEEERDSSSSPEEERTDEVQKLFVVRGRLPWWCIYIGWFLVVSSNLLAAYLIILYGLTFGKEKSIEWLVAMFISMFQSILVIQPFTVIAIAAFFAIVVKSYEYDDIGARFFKQLKSYTGRHKPSTSTPDTRSFHTIRQRCTHFYCPPTGSAVELARERKLIDSKMYSIIKSFLGHLLFIWLVVQVSNGQHDPNSIYLHQAMTNSFSSQLNKVITMADVYGWMKLEFIPALYGDDPATLVDSFFVGSPRLRQLRVKPDRCVNPEAYFGFRPECHTIPSGMLDTGSYSTSWAQTLSPPTTSQSSSPWVYQTQQQAKGSFFLTDPGRYHRGGFSADLGMARDGAENVLTMLQDALWIDQFTKAIIVEWVMYNPNVNLFSVNTLVFRAEGTTKVVNAQDFVILRIYRYTNKFDKFVLTLEVIYILAIVIIVFMEISKWKSNREDYWVFWSYLTIVVILLSAVATTAYIWEYVQAAATMKLYKSNPKMYVSFADIVLLDYILILSLGGVAFCSILKCLKILHYNNSIFLIQNTINSLSSRIASLIFLLFLAITAFAFFGHIAFGSHFQDFSGFLASIQSVFILILRKYDKMLEVIEQFGVQAYFLFAAGNFLLVAVVMNVFIALILDSYSRSKKKFVKYKDHSVIAVLWGWVLSAFSIKERRKRLHKHNSLQSVDTSEEMSR